MNKITLFFIILVLFCSSAQTQEVIKNTYSSKIQNAKIGVAREIRNLVGVATELTKLNQDSSDYKEKSATLFNLYEEIKRKKEILKDEESCAQIFSQLDTHINQFLESLTTKPTIKVSIKPTKTIAKSHHQTRKTPGNHTSLILGGILYTTHTTKHSPNKRITFTTATPEVLPSLHANKNTRTPEIIDLTQEPPIVTQQLTRNRRRESYHNHFEAAQTLFTLNSEQSRPKTRQSARIKNMDLFEQHVIEILASKGTQIN